MSSDDQLAPSGLRLDEIKAQAFAPQDRDPLYPGEALKRHFLEPKGWSQRDLAEKMGVYPNRVNEVITGRRNITPETAFRLSRVFETEITFWLDMQSAVDIHEFLTSEKYEELQDEL